VDRAAWAECTKGFQQAQNFNQPGRSRKRPPFSFGAPPILLLCQPPHKLKYRGEYEQTLALNYAKRHPSVVDGDPRTIVDFACLQFQNYCGHLVRLTLPSPVWAPYFVILWSLRAAVCSDTKRVKKSLALAISWGVFIFLLSAFLLFAGWSRCEQDWRSIVLSAAIALLQVILVFSAMRAYYFMERDTDDRQIVATRALIGIGGIVLSALFIPAFVLPHNASFE
jgi:putative effector of murein hydrolase LrgA (UPF0299 family)